MYSGTRNFRDGDEDRDEMLRQDAIINFHPGDPLSSFHSSADQMLLSSSFVSQNYQYTTRQNSSTEFVPESYMPFHSDVNGANQMLPLSVLPFVAQQEHYLSGRNDIVHNPELFIPTVHSSLSGRDAGYQLPSSLPLVTHTQQHQYTSRQNSSDFLSYMPSFHAGVGILPSSSLVTHPFLSLGTSTPLMPYDLSVQYGLGLEGGTSLLSASSLRSGSSSDRHLRLHEYDATCREINARTQSFGSETGYSSFENAPLCKTADSHMEEKDGIFSRETGGRERYHSPVSGSGSSNLEKSSRFENTITDISRKRYHSPGHSSHSKADCFSGETRPRSRERHHSPIHSNGSPSREKSEYIFSPKETDCSSGHTRSSRSQERHRSSIHHNDSPSRGKRVTDCSSGHTRSSRSRERYRSPIHNNDSPSRSSRSQERHRSPIHNNDSPSSGKREYRFSPKATDFSRGETRSSRSRERHRSSIHHNDSPSRSCRSRERHHSPIHHNDSPSRSSRSRDRHRSPIHNNDSPSSGKREYRFSPKATDFSRGETRSSRSRERHRSPICINDDSPSRSFRSRERHRSPIHNNDSPSRPSRSPERHRSPIHSNDRPSRPSRSQERHRSPIHRNDSPSRPSRNQERNRSPIHSNGSPSRPSRNQERHRSPIHSNDSPSWPSRSQERHRSPIHHNDSPSRPSRSQERHRSPINHNDSPSRPSRSQERHRSPIHSNDSPSRPSRNQERHRSPIHSNDSPSRSSRSQERHRSSIHNNDSPSSGIREYRFSPKETGNDKREIDRTTSRALRCYCLPEPNIQRIMSFQRSDKFYKLGKPSSVKSTSIATEEVVKLHTEFEEMLSQAHCQISVDTSDIIDVIDNTEEDSQYVCKLLDKPEADDDGSDVSDCDLEQDGYITIDESDGDSSSSEDSDQSLRRKFSNTKSLAHPRRLDHELWFNVVGELNRGKECLCGVQDKKKWIVHNIYPNEEMPAACEALGNSGLYLYHYWVTVYPHTNFMTENPTTIDSDGHTYTFEGFSLLSHSSLVSVPRCYLTRFNINYEIIFVQEPIPDNFCINDLNLFSKYLFHDILEMFDWDVSNKGNEDQCHVFHFLPRFTRKIGVSSDGLEKYELLSMSKVFEHLLTSRQPLDQNIKWSDRKAWEEFVGSCVNSLVTKPGWKPSSLRIDNIEPSERDEKEAPMIVHHGIRPVELSFSGDPECQKMFRSYLKLRKLITNRPDSSQKERLKLLKMKLTLDNMKMKDSLRRDCCISVSSRGMWRTGLNSDVTQDLLRSISSDLFLHDRVMRRMALLPHALLLPVLVHHVRHYLSLQTFEEKIGYEFKDKALLQLALTHPSYVMNYGTNPDHARNTLSNCGVKKPRYGDKRNRFKHVKKKGIVHLIEIMTKLEDLEGSQSFIQHNERLEFLGDAILEFICTSHLYFLFPEMNEGGLVTHRASLVQNKHLACVAKKLELDTFMRFSHGPDLCHEEDMEHAIANCLEALLGAIYLDSDVNTVRKLFCQFAFDEIELRELWCNLNAHPLQTHQPKGDRHFISSSDVLKKLVKFEESIGVQFTHIRLLARAFTHPQVGFNNLTLGNNQRMELLGDAVVQWVVTDYLYRHFPEHHEGHLTLLRSSLVNRKMQAEIAGEIGLHDYVNFGITQTSKLRPKHMADLFEAFLAALFVDKGIEPIKLFCKVCLFPRLRDVILNQEWMDAKSQLQSCCITQSKGSDIVPFYKVLKNVGSPNMKFYTVGVYFKGRRLGTGDGDNVREAEMNAAQNALTLNYFPEYARQKRVLSKKYKLQ